MVNIQEQPSKALLTLLNAAIISVSNPQKNSPIFSFLMVYRKANRGESENASTRSIYEGKLFKYLVFVSVFTFFFSFRHIIESY